MAVKMLGGMAGAVGETVQKAAEVFALPIRWIEREQGATRNVIGRTLGSAAFLPFRMTWEVLKGMLRGGRSVAQLAVHLPWIPFWNKERQDVMLATKEKFDSLSNAVDAQHRLAA